MANTTTTKEYLSCSGGSYPSFAGAVAGWYLDPAWQDIRLFPWVDDQALKLSDVYTEMEMEEYRGRNRKRVKLPLESYTDLFKHVKAEGTRILVKGDPGIGKTTFVHKLAYDWANKNLEVFDNVLVVKLKFTDKEQSIASMVKAQIKPLQEDDGVTVELIDEYLRSGRDRVLLVLDGLDEINLKQFPQVMDVLIGQAFRKCCILATIRPYVAEKLQNKITTLAKIKGFSREQAERFIQNILSPTQRDEFLRELGRRKMTPMHKVPLLVQAMALLFKENQNLPRTFTMTYDELILFLRKSCKKNKDLSEPELQEAMDEVNELAYKGLTREDKQLIFSRDEVKNSNTYKLGILSAEKAGSGFNPVEILQFPHKTIQEHSAADHVVKRLLRSDRGPWETIVEQIHRESTLTPEAEPERKRKPELVHLIDPNVKDDRKSDKNGIISSAIQKIMDTAMVESQLERFTDFLRKFVDAGAYEEEVNCAGVTELILNCPLTGQCLTAQEREAVAHYTVELLVETPKEWRAHQKEWMRILLLKDKKDRTTYMIDQKVVVNWIKKDPEMAKQCLLQLASFYKIYKSGSVETEHPFRQPYHYISQDFHQLLDHMDNNKTLLRFIVGKLAEHEQLRDRILLEVAVLAVENSFDADKGGVVPFNELLSFVNDIKMESFPEDEGETPDPSMVSPALIHLRSTMPEVNLELLEPEVPCALRVLGTEAEVEDLISMATRVTQRLHKIHILELENIWGKDGDFTKTYERFSEELYKSQNIVSMEVSNVDRVLVEVLTRNLPNSVQRLSVGTFPAKRTPRGILGLPVEVHLINLILENCLLQIGNLFNGSSFPELKKLSMTDDSYSWEDKITFTWRPEDVLSLAKALNSGRMPKLAELSIRDACLTGCGPQLVQVLTSKSLTSVKLLGAQLNLDDGKTILRSICKGHLDHLEFLDLMNNEDLDPLVKDLTAACRHREITLEINPAPRATGSDVINTMATMASSFLGQGSSQTTGGFDLGSILTTVAGAFTPTGGEQKQQESGDSRKEVSSNMTTQVSSFFQRRKESKPSEPTASEPVDLGSILTTVLGAVSPTSSQPARLGERGSTEESAQGTGHGSNKTYSDEIDLD